MAEPTSRTSSAKQKPRTVSQSKSQMKKRESVQESPTTDPTTEFIDYNFIPRNRVGYMTTMRACVAMMKTLESHHEKGPMIPEPTFYNPPDNSLSEEKLDILEQKVNALEGRLKMVSRRINESRRAQMLLKERVFELENSLRKSKEITLVTSLLNVVPTEEDLKYLEKIKEEEAKKTEITNRIKNAECQNKVLADIMGRAEAIITDSRIIKKQKRVVIIETEPVIIGEDYERGMKKVLPVFDEDEEEKPRLVQPEKAEQVTIPGTSERRTHESADVPFEDLVEGLARILSKGNVIVDEVDRLTGKSSRSYTQGTADIEGTEGIVSSEVNESTEDHHSIETVENISVDEVVDMVQGRVSEEYTIKINYRTKGSDNTEGNNNAEGNDNAEGNESADNRSLESVETIIVDEVDMVTRRSIRDYTNDRHDSPEETDSPQSSDNTEDKK